MAAREALIVATGRYDDAALSQLRSPAQDAAALAAVLRDEAIGGFHVEQVVDQTDAAVRRAVHGFFADRSRDDLLLLHLSCHGIKDDEGRLYFAATDTIRDALEVTAVPAAFLNDQMDRCRARSIVLLLDCCYAGAFAAGSKGDAGVHLKEKFDGHGRAILTASNAIEYSWEGGTLSGEGRPSVFTAAIVDGLRTGDADRDGDGLVSLPELHDYVTERMLARVPRQTPLRWELGIEGGLHLARNPRPRLPAEVTDAVAHPLPGVRAGVVEELERLLAGSPAVAREARAVLERLLEDDSLTVRQAAAGALGAAVPDTTGAAEREAAEREAAEREAEREAARLRAAAEREAAEREAAEREAAEREAAEREAAERETAEREAAAERARRGGYLPPHRRRSTAGGALVGVLRERPLVAAGVGVIALVVLAWLLIGDGDTVVEVSSRARWTDTRLDLGVGDEVEIFASGEVCDDLTRPDQCFGPDGVEDVHGEHRGDPFDANHAALVATTENELSGTVIEIGSHGSFTVETAGRLLLGVNDGRHDDNTGSYEARVRVTRR